MPAPEPEDAGKAPGIPPRPEPGVPLIATAMREEFEAIARLLSDRQRLRAGEDDRGFLLKGRMAGVPVRLAMTGDGCARAGCGVSLLLGESPASLVIGAGAAGALVPSLRAGEIVVAARVVDAEGDAPPPEAGWVARATALGARPATFVTVARPMTSPEEKREVALRFGIPDSTAATVDMESAAWARAAAGRGIPSVILRAVSDTLEEDLPGFLPSCLSADGSVDRAAVARRLLLRPAALPKLLRMRRRVREGSEALGHFLEKLLPEMI